MMERGSERVRVCVCVREREGERGRDRMHKVVLLKNASLICE